MAKIRIVIADREEVFRAGLAKLLKRELNIEVVSTCTLGLEAVENVHKYQPDVILIHGVLKDSSGIEVAQCISEGQSKTNIIVLTHSKAEDDLVSAIRAGAKAYLPKDVSIDNLIRTITLVAEGGVVVAPVMATKLLAEFNILEEDKSAEKLASFLSQREREVLILVAQGFTNKEIATTLTVSDNTVKVHLRNIMEKLHAHTRQQAVNLLQGETNCLRLLRLTQGKRS